MLKRFLLSVILVIFGFFSLSALDKTEHYHDMAVSDDGEWIFFAGIHENEETELRNGDVDTLNEIIWAVPGKMNWAYPQKLLTFNRKGWTFPAVCYNKQNDSFLVFHTDHNPTSNENGFYEFKGTTIGDNSYVQFDCKFTQFPKAGFGRFYTNENGIFFVHETQLPESDYYVNANFTSQIYKITSNGYSVSWEMPETLKTLKIRGMHRDGADYKNTKHTLQDVVTPTKNGLIIEDYNRTDWWYYNCNTEKIKKFDSKQAAIDYDIKLNTNHNNNFIIHGFLILLTTVLIAFFVITRKQLRKPANIDSMNKIELNKIIYETQELERANISRDIHDSVIQDMRGIRIEAELLHVNEDSLARQTKIENIATDCVIKLRNICYNLTPAELTTHIDGDNSRIELVSIIQTLVQQFTERTNIPCAIKVDPAFEYPTFTKNVSLNLFRVVQEALNNIEKHSYATNASIFMKTENRKMKIFITDDGVGFDTNIAKVHDDGLIHFGVQMMKDRMELIGGKITFISGNNDGTEVQLEIGIKPVSEPVEGRRG